MATTFSMIDIFNAALSATGWDTITVSDTGLPEYILMSTNWPLIVEAEMEDGGYEFTKAESTPTEGTTGGFGFDNDYEVPAAALHVRKVWWQNAAGKRTHVTDWVQDSDTVYATSPAGLTCVLEYAVDASEGVWSATFAKGVTHALEALLLRSLAGEPDEARERDTMAAAMFQRARTNASKARSPGPIVRQGGLSDARFRRGTY